MKKKILLGVMMAMVTMSVTACGAGKTTDSAVTAEANTEAQPQEGDKGLKEMFDEKDNDTKKKEEETEVETTEAETTEKKKEDTKVKDIITAPKGTPLLREGSKGGRVRDLQKALNKIGNKLVIDGVYGVKTKEAIKKLQKQANISIDGIYGNNTAKELQKRL